MGPELRSWKEPHRLVLIGIGIVELQLPLGLATAHNLGAALLLLAVVAANHRLWRSA